MNILTIYIRKGVNYIMKGATYHNKQEAKIKKNINPQAAELKCNTLDFDYLIGVVFS